MLPLTVPEYAKCFNVITIPFFSSCKHAHVCQV